MSHWPPTDRLGRRAERRFCVPSFLWAIPGLAEQFSGEVPEEMWASDVRDGEPIAIIPCVCGAEVIVRLAGMAECECGRFFAHFGRSIKVAKPDAPSAQVPA